MESIRTSTAGGDRRRPPDRRDPRYVEWLIDEGLIGSFPASDPSSIVQPHARRTVIDMEEKR